MSLLKIQNLNIEFPLRNYTHAAAKDVSFDIKAGEIVGVVGESGAGKSTIGNAIINLLSKPGRVTSGSIKLNDDEITGLDYSAMQNIRGKRIGFIFQDPMTSLNPLFTIGEQLCETMIQNLNISKSEASSRAINLLKQVGIPFPEDRLQQYPHQFSGGMRQRVVIAIALSCNPELIIADEPTTALDVSVQDQILNLIKDMCKKRKVGVMLVTHDMGVIAHTADRVVVMYQGRVVEIGNTKQILEQPVHDYTKSLISAVPLSTKKLKRFPLVNYIESTQENLPKIDVKTHWLGQAQDVLEMTDILTIKDVSLKFSINDSLFEKNRRYVEANKDVTFSIKRGESFGLVGESGSGKSTIARVIAGLYHANSGSVHYNGVDLTALSDEQRMPYRQSIQMIFQNPYSSLNPRFTVFDIIAEPIYLHNLAPKANVAKIVGDLLDHVGLGAASANKFPHEFSGGQRQRISIARALATRPQLLICDEPTSALDVSVQAQILNLLKDLQDELNLTMLFITHDLPVVRQMCDRIAVMQSGQLLEVSETEMLFTEPSHPYTKELLRLMPALDNLKR